MIRSGSAGRRARFVRRLAASDDSGVSLIFALIFITVVAMVIGVVLAYVQTSLRGTTALQASTEQQSAADGAAQIAINEIRQETFAGGSDRCFGSGGQASSKLNLSNFYGGASTYSATVTCKFDDEESTSGSTGGGGSGQPVNAILTLNTSGNKDGLALDAGSGFGRQIKVQGSVFSNSNIDTNRMSSDSSVTARDDCSGTITAHPKRCDIHNQTNHAGDDPDYDAPSGPTTLRSVPHCAGNHDVVTFLPGRYTNLSGLDDLTDGSCNGTFWFEPGTYYFDFDGTWNLQGGYVVGGTKTNEVRNGHTPKLPGACETPYPPDPKPKGWTAPDGVEFVFTGQSRMELDGGSIELCGDPESNGPPIAIYGLKHDMGTLDGEDGCITSPFNTCSVISSGNSRDSRDSEMYIEGTAYVPMATIDITLNEQSGELFSYGVIAHNLEVDASQDADLSDPIISAGDGGSQLTPGNTIVYLTVVVCTKQTNGQCSGDAALTAKVGFLDPTGEAQSGSRRVTVYNWSTARD